MVDVARVELALDTSEKDSIFTGGGVCLRCRLCMYWPCGEHFVECQDYKQAVLHIFVDGGQCLALRLKTFVKVKKTIWFHL